MIKNAILFAIAFIYISNVSNAQIVFLTEKTAVENALQMSQQMKIANLKVEKQTALKGSTVNLPNLEILMQSPDGEHFRPGLMQGFDFPTVYGQQSKLQKSAIKVAESEKGIATNVLIYNVRTAFNDIQYAQQKFLALKNQDSTFAEIIGMNEIRFKVGQISALENINGQAYYRQIQFAKDQAQAELQNAKMQLAIWMGNPADTSFKVTNNYVKISNYEINQTIDTSFVENPIKQYYVSQKDYFNRQLKLDKNKRLPGFMVGLLNQATNNTPFQYYLSVGVRLPIWYWAYSSKIKADKKDLEIVQSQANYANYTLFGEYTKELAMYKQYTKALNYYENIGIAQSNEILRNAKESYRLGSIGYFVYLQNINQAYQIQFAYLEAIRNHNKSIVSLQYIKGEQKY